MVSNTLCGSGGDLDLDRDFGLDLDRDFGLDFDLDFDLGGLDLGFDFHIVDSVNQYYIRFYFW
jgi:hypothetical protein